MKKLLGLLLLSTLLVLSATIDVAIASRTLNISNNSYDSEEPQINDNRDILWIQKNVSNDYDLFLYDTKSRVTSQITNNSSTEKDYQLGASGHVAWSANSGSGYEIFLYDSDSGMTKQLTSNDYADEYPQINAAGQVVWHGDVNSNIKYDIFLYDHTSGESIRLTNSANDDSYPQINDNGDIAWSNGSGNTDYEIYFAQSCTNCHSFPSGETPYDGHAITRVTNNSSYDGGPKMNNNGQIVWTGDAGETDPNDFELFLYDNSSGRTVRLTNDTYEDSEQKINDKGNIAWQSYDGEDNEMFFTKSCTQCHSFPSAETPYDGHATVQLSDNSFDEQDAQINKLGHVIWPREVTWGDYRLMTYKGSTVREIPLPDFSEKLWKPMINSSGEIVWEDYDSNIGEGTAEIYFMKSTPLGGMLLQLLLSGY